MSLRQLMLLRHAKASPARLGDDSTSADHVRPLNAQGQATAAAIRNAIRSHGLIPDVVLVSSARRTLQTLEGLEPWDDTPLVEPMDRLYLAPAAAILQVLHTVSETVRSAMVIGHNPGLHDLAILLLGDQAKIRDSAARRLYGEFPTGGLAVFTVPQHWRELGEGGGARLDRFVNPRDLTGQAT